MSVVSLDTVSDNDATGSNEAAQSESKKQQVVHFDVSGQLFRTTSQTVSRYPNSLLHRLMLDHPEAVAAEKALFVDRRPDYFPWILECYRGSHHVKEAPEIPNDALGKELEFYGLPKSLMSAAQESSPKVLNGRRVFYELLAQIRASEMTGFVPLEVCVFDEFRDRRSIQRKWYIGPIGSWQARFSGKDNEFTDFIEVTHDSASIDEHETFEDHVFIKRAGAPALSFSVLDISGCGNTSGSGATCMTILTQKAAKHGLTLEQRYHSTNDFKVPYLYLSP